MRVQSCPNRLRSTFPHGFEAKRACRASSDAKELVHRRMCAQRARRSMAFSDQGGLPRDLFACAERDDASSDALNLEARWEGPRLFDQAHTTGIARNTVKVGAIRGRECLQTIERPLLLKDLGVELERCGGRKAACAATWRLFLVLRMRCRVRPGKEFA
jgi:hypothetical protein